MLIYLQYSLASWLVLNWSGMRFFVAANVTEMSLDSVGSVVPEELWRTKKKHLYSDIVRHTERMQKRVIEMMERVVIEML